MQHAHGLGARADDQVERVARALDVVRVDGCRAPARQVAEARVGQRRAEAGRGDDAEDVVDVERAGRRHPPRRCRDPRSPAAAGRHRRPSPRAAGRAACPTRTGCAFTQRIAASSSCSGMSCGSTPSPPRRASVAASRAPVTEFMFAETSGIVAVVPSPGRQVDVEPARDRRAPRHEEDVRIGQVDLGLLTVELHARKGSDSSCTDNDAQSCSRRPLRSRGTGRADWVRLNSRACGPLICPARSQSLHDESRRSSVSSQVTGVGVSSEGEFGANEWLVDELYEQFKVDKNSVDKAWWPILEAYHPVDTTASRRQATPRDAPAPATAAPATAPRPHAAPHARPQRPRTSASEAARRRPGAGGAPDDRADPGRRRAAGRPHDRAPGRPAADPGAGARSPPSVGREPTEEDKVTVLQGHDQDPRRQHGRVAHGPDRDERAHHPGEADDRQPHRHQQPHVAHARRQDQLHPPHRLGAHPRAQGVPEPERVLRRDRRQAVGRRSRAHQPRHRDRPAQARRHARAPGAEHQARRHPDLQRVPRLLRGPRSPAPAATSSPPPTSRARRSR